MASASCTGAPAAASAAPIRTTRVPCTWRRNTGAAPVAAASGAGWRDRAGTSPTAVPTFIEAYGPLLSAAGPRRHQRADAGERQSGASQSPECSRRVGAGRGLRRWNAGSAMQVSKTRITVGTWSRRRFMRRALKICGTSTQSARPGVSPWQKRPVAGCRRAGARPPRGRSRPSAGTSGSCRPRPPPARLQ